MKPAAVADGLLPGSGLVLDGRLGWGVPLLVPAVLIISSLLLALLVAGFLASRLALYGLPAYAVLSAAALLIRHRLALRERVDPEATRRLARAAEQAWLQGAPDAAEKARAVTRAAPEMAQAWRLLALVAGDAAAARRADAIDRRSR